jgi:hypothetical protein
MNMYRDPVRFRVLMPSNCVVAALSLRWQSFVAVLLLLLPVLLVVAFIRHARKEAKISHSN